MRKWKWFIMALVIGLALALGTLSACKRNAPADITAQGSADYGWLKTDQFVIQPSGAVTGHATATGSSNAIIRGHLYAIHIDYDGDITTSTDITLSQASPAQTIMVKSNSATDAWYYPVVQCADNTATAKTWYDRMPMNGQMAVAIGGSTGKISSNTAAITITVWWGE